MRKGNSYFLIFLLLMLSVALVRCDRQDGPAERFGERVDKATDDVVDATDDVADDIGDAADDAADNIEDAADEMMDK